MSLIPRTVVLIQSLSVPRSEKVVGEEKINKKRMRKNGERMNEHKILAGAKILFFITVSVNFVISWTWCDQEPEPKMHYLRSRIILTKTGSFEGIISSHESSDTTILADG